MVDTKNMKKQQKPGQKRMLHLKEHFMHTHVQSNIIHNSQNIKATQLTINRWMDEQNVVCTYSKILFSLKKESNWHMPQRIWTLRTLR